MLSGLCSLPSWLQLYCFSKCWPKGRLVALYNPQSTFLHSYTMTSVDLFTGLSVLCLAFLRRSLLDLAVQCQSQCTPTFALIKLVRCVCTFASPSHPTWIARPTATMLRHHKAQCFSLNILQTWLKQGCTQPTL